MMTSFWRKLLILFVAVEALLLFLHWNSNIKPPAVVPPKQQKQQLASQQVESLVESERLILALQRELHQISRATLNLSLPDWRTQDLFEASVLLRDIAPESPLGGATGDSNGPQKHDWPIQTRAVLRKADEVDLFEPLLSTVGYLQHFHFKLVKGEFASSERNSFVSQVAFGGLGRSKENKLWQAIDGHAKVTWRRQSESEKAPKWRISGWELTDLAVTNHAANTFFREVLDSVIPSASDRNAARRSVHEELVVNMVKKGKSKLPGPKFKHQFEFVSAGYHPGLAIVDINQDGWDDLYVMSRWGTNQLFINSGQGTFQEDAKAYNLDITAHCTSALFADFDNDGDPDLFLGRSAQRSLYFVNEEGKFIQRKSRIQGKLPAMVSAISAADYNKDGLLDVYFSTYGQRESLLREFLPADKIQELILRDRQESTNQFINGFGAPNLLLANQGNGFFKPAPESEQLEFCQTTFQSSWTDFDRDGDPDLYVSNDFGPDRLMRNDFPEGFVDVTEKYGHKTMMGFGMGVAWGDYDLDGKQDLYVSNMYSKAGMRITAQIEGLDERFTDFANGNRLYRQTGQGFQLTSGTEPSQMQVTRAGWSWGGQFTDFDNDGYPDIYVVNGYFTAPDEVAVVDDL